MFTEGGMIANVSTYKYFDLNFLKVIDYGANNL